MMQLFQTTAGVVRADLEGLRLLSFAGTLQDALEGDGLLALKNEDGVLLPREEPPRFEPPLAARRFFFVGLNYASHATEVGQPVPTDLLYGFQDAGAAQSSPGARVRRPPSNPDMVDYEGEIAVIVGARLDGANLDEARQAIAAVTAAIDLTARDVQMAGLRAGGPSHPDVTNAKLYEGFKPIGPGLLVLDTSERDSLDIGLETRVNGDLRQEAKSGDLLFSMADCLSRMSQAQPLEVGDVVLTGTPAGVGFVTGAFLKAGDTVSVRVGSLPPLVAIIA